MDNANQEELRQWVVTETAHLDPPAGWQPDSAAAFQRFHGRLKADRWLAPWRRWPMLAAAAIGVACLLSLPAARVLAQQFWQFLTVPRVAAIRVNPWPEGVPSPAVKVMGRPIPPIPARDAEDARGRVRYTPRLPYPPGVLSGGPRLSTTFAMSAGTVVHVADLQLALSRAGIAGLSVPPQWEGAQLSVHTSSMVIAEWPGIVLVQSLPLTLTTPTGFDFEAFSALVLRVVGVGPDEAQRLAQEMGTAPHWLFPIDRSFFDKATLEEVALNSGPATLHQEFEDNGEVSRTTLVWTVPDRVYLLSGKLSRQLAIATANAVQ